MHASDPISRIQTHATVRARDTGFKFKLRGLLENCEYKGMQESNL